LLNVAENICCYDDRHLKTGFNFQNVECVQCTSDNGHYSIGVQ